MIRISLLFNLILISSLAFSQERALSIFLADTSLIHASVSICIKDADNGEIVTACNPRQSLIPASVMKLVTSGVALELLGPKYNFRTIIGYKGSLHKHTGRLSGNIVISGGGDPALGSEYFKDHYNDFLNRWVSDIKLTGIRRVDGRVITDDSYYDFFPVPAKWQWEDIGNYYGAGVYGLSVFDNTVKIHLTSSAGGSPVKITGIDPKEYRYYFDNRLSSSGTSDEGYAFAAPYTSSGWLTGTIPVSQDDFILKVSMADPPLFIAGLLNEKLEESGIRITEDPTTIRIEGTNPVEGVRNLSEISSPPLADIIEILNHESVNLYAETLLKQLGKSFRNSGSTAAGADVVMEFLINAGIPAGGMFIEDGSGLSPGNAISSEDLTNFLIYMKNRSSCFSYYYKSLPEAGKEGTLKYYFRDPVFEGRINAKSGSMNRVRCYAGYLTTNSGRNIVFSILVNNFTGSSQKVISGIEGILKEIILH